MKTELLVMAAGIGTRFGNGIKQLEPVGPNGEIIMDYSIYDAINAGFNKIVFIIRRDLEKDFRKIAGNRLERVCSARGVEVEYVFQEIDNIPEGYAVPQGRKKPWGTGQAILSAADAIDSPFVVINSDDYYGREAFALTHRFLSVNRDDKAYCMVGFKLKNTLSDNGEVTRGICSLNDDGYLEDIAETRNIEKIVNGDGTVGAFAAGRQLDINSDVSMNMWGLMPSFVDTVRSEFVDFLRKDVPADPERAEFLLPVIISKLLRRREISVKVLETRDRWFGVTYLSDKPKVVENFRKLIDSGVYSADLYNV